MTYFLGTILFLLPSYLIRFKILGIPATLLEILIVAFLFAALLLANKSSWQKIKSLGKINYAIIGFALAAGISVLVASDKLTAAGQLKAFILEPILLFYACVIHLDTKNKLNTALKFLLAGASIVSIFGLFQYFTHILLPIRFWGTGSEPLRITSIFEYPNALALYLAPLIGLYFVLWLKKYELFTTKYLLPFCLGVMSLAMLLTSSRGGLFALIFVLGLVIIRRLGYKKAALVALTLSLVLLFLPGVRQRILLGLADQSSSDHFQLLKVGIDKVVSNPLFGNGLGGFEALSVNYPHNIFLNFWLETGLLGLVSFAGIVMVSWKQKNYSSLTFAAGISLLILMVHGLVDVPYFKNDLSVLFWFTVSIFYLEQKER